jgi:excisionase family DNA binding protein
MAKSNSAFATLAPNPELLTIPQAAARLTVSKDTLNTWVWKQRVKTVRIGKCVRIPAAEVDRLIVEGTTPARK